jgi:hypothetical protein
MQQKYDFAEFGVAVREILLKDKVNNFHIIFIRLYKVK